MWYAIWKHGGSMCNVAEFKQGQSNNGVPKPNFKGFMADSIQAD